jgi:hypothetical protein
MFTVSIDENLTIQNVFDTDIYIDPSVVTYPITSEEQEMIAQSGQMGLWQYKNGVVVASEFAPEIEKTSFNANQKKQREIYYQLMSDPIFMKWQRQEATQQEWLDAVEQVKLMFPYQE